MKNKISKIAITLLLALGMIVPGVAQEPAASQELPDRLVLDLHCLQQIAAECTPGSGAFPKEHMGSHCTGTSTGGRNCGLYVLLQL